MKIYEFMFYCTNTNFQKVEIYDIEMEKVLYRGLYKDMSSVIKNKELQTFESLTKDSDVLVINV